MQSLTRIDAGGATALYDAILFSLLQFEGGLGRKAIVLLTDGDDYNSRFGYGRVQRDAARSGIPVYFIALSGFESERPKFRKDDLETIAKDSGGRVFYVSDMDQVVSAYRNIGDELRSQYILAFTTERALTDAEAAKIRVEVSGRRNKTRWVVGRE